MDAPFQIVGCLLSSKPADPLIDAWVAAVRRERAVVPARSAQGATFVRLNATDTKLIALASAALAGPGGPTLRFGFAFGLKDRASTPQDALSASKRLIAQANELAAAARPGEVLVSPQLALLLMASDYTFEAREVKRSGGRRLMACALDLDAASRDDSARAEPSAASAPTTAAPAMERKTSALGGLFELLLARAEQLASQQDELEAQQDAVWGAAAAGAAAASSPPAAPEVDFDAQMAHLEARLAVVDQIEQRVERLLRVAPEVEGKLAEQLARDDEAQRLKIATDATLVQLAEVQRRLEADLGELRAKVEDLLGRLRDTDERIAQVESRRRTVEEVQSRANGIVHMLEDINVNLELLGEQRAVVDHVGEKLARLDFTLQEANNTLRALQREREVAERIEQGIKALRTRSSAHQAAHE